MENSFDFLQWFGTDMSLIILRCLDNPSDLIRASSVSHFWRNFVIVHGLCKQLCMRMFPHLSCVARVIEPSCSMEKSVDVGSANSTESETLEKDHRVYAPLLQALTAFVVSDCIAYAIGASSTDNYPEESIINTLDPRDIGMGRASYWSSEGQSNPAVPETLIYKLRADLCVITEINIQPFRAYFQIGYPIYSAKSVRFRMGHPKSLRDIESDLKLLPLQQPADDKFTWTYTSEEFPMAQENRLQKFKLPEPVLCIGGYLQIELLGRVQKQELDGLYYICVSHVQVLGKSLFPAFNVEILEPSGKLLLKYYPEALHRTLQCSSEVEPLVASVLPEMMEGHLEGFVEFLMPEIAAENEFDEFIGVEPFEWEDEDNDMDEMLIL